MYGIYILLIFTIFLPTAPQEVTILEILYSLVFLFTSSLGFFKIIYTKTSIKKIIRCKLTLPIFCLFILILFSYFNTNASPKLWIRGVVPFLSFLMFFIVRAEFKSFKDIEKTLLIFRVLAILISGTVLNSVIPVLDSSLSKGNFITIRAALESGAFSSFTIMLPAFFMAQFFISRKKSKIDALILVLLLTIVLFTFLRSVLIVLSLVALLVFFDLLASKNVKIIFKGTFALISTISAVYFLYYISNDFRNIVALIYNGFLSRFQQLERFGDVRAVENSIVFSHYRDRPLLGHGLGFQYQYLRDLGNGKSMLWSGGYTHNIFTYYLLVFGILGTLVLIWLIFSSYQEFQQSKKSLSIDSVAYSYLFSFSMALLALLLYGNFQSVHRSLSYYLLVSLLMGVITNIKYIKFPDQPSLRNRN